VVNTLSIFSPLRLTLLWTILYCSFLLLFTTIEWDISTPKYLFTGKTTFQLAFRHERSNIWYKTTVDLLIWIIMGLGLCVCNKLLYRDRFILYICMYTSHVCLKWSSEHVYLWYSTYISRKMDWQKDEMDGIMETPTKLFMISRTALREIC